MIALAVALAILAGLGGLYLSYYAGTAGGASVALAIVVVYLASLPAGQLLSFLHGEKRAPAQATIG
jgi:ABC-type Mn2+/Zn2+ transport system permease subunit